MATLKPGGIFSRYTLNPSIPADQRDRIAAFQASVYGDDTAAGAPGTTTGGNLAGAPAFGYAGAYGGIPQVPSPGASQGSAIGANLGALPQLTDLAGQLNTFNNQQALGALQANLPGYDAMTAQSSANIGNNLSGAIAPDVWRNLQQMAAERGTAIGSPGSPNSEAGLLRALGLTTLDLQNLGQQQLSGAVARTPVGPQFNPAAMFLSPEQWQEAQMAANLYASAPIPALRAQAELAALRSGVGAGRGSTAPSGGVGYTATPVGRGTGVPQAPQYGAGTGYNPRPASPNPAGGWGQTSWIDPLTGEHGFDAMGTGAARPTMTGIGAISDPYSFGFGEYSFGNSDYTTGGSVPPGIEALAETLHGDAADDYWWNFGQYGDL